MRGQDKPAKSLTLSGNIYLLNHDESTSITLQKGDLRCYLSTDCKSDTKSRYQQKGQKGFFKAEIYDGREWHLIDTIDFFECKENYYSKNEIPIHTYTLCKEIFLAKSGTILYKTYRNHYSTHLYEREGYKGKKSPKYFETLKKISQSKMMNDKER